MAPQTLGDLVKLTLLLAPFAVASLGCSLGGLFGGSSTSSSWNAPSDGGGDGDHGGASTSGDAGGDGGSGGSHAVLEPGMRHEASEGHRLISLGSQAGRPTEPDVVLARGQCSEMTTGGDYDDYGVTDTIGCGESIVGHTRGGVQVFDTAFYEHHFCTPATTQHDGGDERIYRLSVPDGRLRAWVYLDTPCADLDLSVIKWSGRAMPNVSSTVADCEMFPKDGTRREIIDVTSDRASEWLIAVEGKDEEEGAFGLTVLCVPW